MHLLKLILLFPLTWLILSLSFHPAPDHSPTFSQSDSFRDLNHNGQMDDYENPVLAVDDRVEDLLSRMTLEEKAGMLFITGAPVSADGDPAGRVDLTGPGARLPTIVETMHKQFITHFNIWEIPADPAVFAQWYNQVQAAASRTRLGIPVSIASDPRHHFSQNIFAMRAQGFTQFCETLGFAALNDADLMQRFGEIVREEYLAVGIRIALHPQVDLATEPRWPRISGGFGEDAEITARMASAYILGMQGTRLGSQSIACMTKHFPGGGPQKDGLDPHFEFQQGQIYPGNQFQYHLIPFEAAITAGTAAIMPYYGVPTGQTDEDVAMAFNKAIITTLLRDTYQYEGVICTDWGLITDRQMGPDVVWPARAWGVEHLSEADRVLRILTAGCDQFGGESRPELVIQLVNDQRLSGARIDQSVRRLLRQKFLLGLFDHPFVDVERVHTVLNREANRTIGERTQQESMTLLKNDDALLPLRQGQLRIYTEGMDSAVVARYARVVSTPEAADLAIIRLQTPWYPVDTKNPFARTFHHGDLDFKGDEKAHILQLLRTVPTIVDIYLDRPAVIPEISQSAKALIANYGASDKALCEILFGNSAPKGRLPFELPSSMEAVYQQKSDVPHDSQDPLYPYGFGLRYGDE